MATVALSLVVAERWYYQDKIYPGIYVGDLSLGGQTFAEAKDIIEKGSEKLKNGVYFSWQDKNLGNISIFLLNKLRQPPILESCL